MQWHAHTPRQPMELAEDDVDDAVLLELLDLDSVPVVHDVDDVVDDEDDADVDDADVDVAVDLKRVDEYDDLVDRVKIDVVNEEVEGEEDWVDEGG